MFISLQLIPNRFSQINFFHVDTSGVFPLSPLVSMGTCHFSEACFECQLRGHRNNVSTTNAIITSKSYSDEKVQLLKSQPKRNINLQI